MVLAGLLTLSYGSWNVISLSTIALALIVCCYAYRWLHERNPGD